MMAKVPAGQLSGNPYLLGFYGVGIINSGEQENEAPIFHIRFICNFKA